MFQDSNFSKRIIEFTHSLSKHLSVFLWWDGTGFSISKKLLYQEFTTREFQVDLMAVAVASSVEVFD